MNSGNFNSLNYQIEVFGDSLRSNEIAKDLKEGFFIIRYGYEEN